MDSPTSSWSFGQAAGAYAAALLVIDLLDAVWLGWLARDFYRGALGDTMVADVRWVPALLFYLAYPAGLLALALTPMPDGLWQAAARGALVGLVAYGTYDLSNFATLKPWSWKLTLVDMAWGTCLSAAAAAGAWVAWVRLAR